MKNPTLFIEINNAHLDTRHCSPQQTPPSITDTAHGVFFYYGLDYTKHKFYRVGHCEVSTSSAIVLDVGLSVRLVHAHDEATHWSHDGGLWSLSPLINNRLPLLPSILPLQPSILTLQPSMLSKLTKRKYENIDQTCHMTDSTKHTSLFCPTKHTRTFRHLYSRQR